MGLGHPPCTSSPGLPLAWPPCPHLWPNCSHFHTGKAGPDFQINLSADCLGTQRPTLNYTLLFRIIILAIFGGDEGEDRPQTPRSIHSLQEAIRSLKTGRMISAAQRMAPWKSDLSLCSDPSLEGLCDLRQGPSPLWTSVVHLQNEGFCWRRLLSSLSVLPLCSDQLTSQDPICDGA